MQLLWNVSNRLFTSSLTWKGISLSISQTKMEMYNTNTYTFFHKYKVHMTESIKNHQQKSLFSISRGRWTFGTGMHTIFLSSGGYQKNIARTYLCSSVRFFDITCYCWSAVFDFSQSCAMAHQCEWVQTYMFSTCKNLCKPGKPH